MPNSLLNPMFNLHVLDLIEEEEKQQKNKKKSKDTKDTYEETDESFAFGGKLLRPFVSAKTIAAILNATNNTNVLNFINENSNEIANIAQNATKEAKEKLSNEKEIVYNKLDKAIVESKQAIDNIYAVFSVLNENADVKLSHYYANGDFGKIDSPYIDEVDAFDTNSSDIKFISKLANKNIPLNEATHYPVPVVYIAYNAYNIDNFGNKKQKESEYKLKTNYSINLNEDNMTLESNPLVSTYKNSEDFVYNYGGINVIDARLKELEIELEKMYNKGSALYKKLMNKNLDIHSKKYKKISKEFADKKRHTQYFVEEYNQLSVYKQSFLDLQKINGYLTEDMFNALNTQKEACAKLESLAKDINTYRKHTEKYHDAKSQVQLDAITKYIDSKDKNMNSQIEKAIKDSNEYLKNGNISNLKVESIDNSNTNKILGALICNKLERLNNYNIEIYSAISR